MDGSRTERFLAVAFRIVLAFIALRSTLDLFTNVRGPGGLNPSGWLGLAALLCGLSLLALPWREVRRDRVCLRIEIAVGAWLGFLLISVATVLYERGFSGNWAVREWIRLATVGVTFLAVLRAARCGERNRLLRALALAMFIPALVGSVQLFTGTGMEIKGSHRIHGSFVHPNPFGFHLTFAVVFCWMMRRFSARAWFWIGAGVLQLVLLLATKSFTGLAMVATAGAVWMVLAGIGVRAGRERRRRLIGLSVLGALGFTICVGVLWERIAYEYRPQELEQAFETGQMKSSGVWRLVTWHRFIKASAERPWLGHGLGASSQHSPMPMEDGSPAEPHNDALRILFDLGGVGVAATLAAIGVVLAGLWQAWRWARNAEERALTLAGFAVMLSVIPGALNDNVFIATAFLVEAGALVAMAIGAVFADEFEPMEKSL